MSEENTSPAAPESQDTRTRKTVRLRSAGAPPQPQDRPISDPLTVRDTDTGNLEILDDTQTRKTLKLKPMVPGAGAAPKLNLGGAQDTNTRKTVVLRPTAAVAPGVSLPQTVLKGSDAAESKAEVDDQTAAVPRPAAAPAAPKVSLSVGAPKVALTPPGAAAPAPKAEVDDQTAAVPHPAAAPAAPKVENAPVEDDDQTVKMKRPPRLVPPPPPTGVSLRPPVAGAAAADDAKATVKLPARPAPGAIPKPPVPAIKPPVAAAPATPKAPAPAPAPAPEAPKAEAPATAPEAPKAEAPAAAPAAAPEAPKAEAPKQGGGDDLEISLAPSKRSKPETEEDAEAPKKKSVAKPQRKFRADDMEDSPSFFYCAVAVISLVLIIGAAAISAVHYLDFDHGLKYYDKVPGLPMAK